MSFQRDLTGSSNLYANVILNTNICASSVSTINLSATNASFTNITTNTYTFGNVSTPNLIATTGYISTLYVSNQTISSLNISTLNLCNLYSSNASITNLSTSFINASTVRAYITYTSTENVCLVSTSTLYSSYNYLTNASITNLSVTGPMSVSVISASLLDIEGTVAGATAQFKNYQLKNTSGITIMTLEQTTVNSSRIQLNIENSSITGYDITRLGTSILTLNTSGSTFYSPLSVSNLTTSSISTSTLAVATLNLSNLNACNIDTTNISMSNCSATTLDVGYEFNYRTTGSGLLYNFKASAGSQGSAFYNNLNVQTARHRFQYLDQDLMSINSSQILVYNPLNSSYRFSVSYMSTSQINVCGNFANTVYSTGLTLRNFSISPSTLQMTNPTLLQLNNVYNTGGVATEYYAMKLTADVNDAVVEISPNINYAITHNGTSAIEHIRTTGTSRRWNFYSPIYNVCNTCLTNVSAVNASIDNLSVTTLTATNFNPLTINTSNICVSNLSVITLTSTSGTITTLNSTSTFVSNLSASNISVPGRISVSNISATSISATGRINADTIRATTDIVCSTGLVQGSSGAFSTLSASFLGVSQSITASTITINQVSSTSIATSWDNASNISVINLSYTTATGTTLRATTGNFSTVAISNAIVNLSVSSLGVSQATFHTSGGVSTYGTVTLVNQKMIIQSVGTAATGLQLGNSGNIRFEVSPTGVSSYVPFYVSAGNFSTLTAGNLTSTSINATNLSVSTANFSSLSASTWNFPSTITTSTIYASSGVFDNVSDVVDIKSGGVLVISNDGLYLRNPYANQGGIPYIQMDYWKTSTSALNQGFTMFADEARGSVIDGGALPIDYRSGDISQATNSSTDGWLFKNIINTSYQVNFSKLSVSNVSSSGTANISTGNFSTVNASTLNASTFVTSTITLTTLNASTVNSSTVNVSTLNNISANISNLSVSNLTLTNVSITTLNSSNIYTSNISTNHISIVSGITVPGTINSNSSNTSLILHGTTTNTSSSGIKVPNYIDGLDLASGLFIGYNHLSGFVNFSRVIRSFANITVDGNVNQITATNNLGIGRNLTTGSLLLGDTAMTGNISINTSGNIALGNVSTTGNITFDTAGDAIFGCDRRSTWNTSGLLASSTQLGSFYQQTVANSATKTSSGQTFIFSPGNANTSLTTVPVGLYLVSAQGRIKTTATAINASVTAMNIGYCYGTGYNFTSANTTRQAFAAVGSVATYLRESVSEAISFTGVLNMSTTGNYIGAFLSVTLGQAATIGSLDLILDYCTVVKIA